MHWIITKDLLCNSSAGDTFQIKSKVNRARMPKELAAKIRATADESERQTLREEFKATLNYEFRLYDDDNVLYYEGLCKDLDDQSADCAFAPLDWAMNDVGCTRMDYRKKGVGRWQTL